MQETRVTLLADGSKFDRSLDRGEEWQSFFYF